MSNKEQLEILGNVKEVRDAQHTHIDITLQNEDHAITRCNNITHQISKKAWMIIGLVAVLGANSIRMHYSWKGDVDKANKHIAKLEKSVKKDGKVVVWFDKQRQYTNKHFQQVDMKYPAQYERWASDGSVIERWHWRVEGKPETYRFGDRIQRCVAIYKKGQFVGYRAYSMEDYPTDDWRPAAENKIKEDSLVLRVIGSRKELSHVGGIGWSMVFEEGKFKCLKQKNLNGVQKTYESDIAQAIGMFNLVDYDRDDLYQICSENEDLDKLYFTALLQEDKQNFKRLAAALPVETREKWDIYLEWSKANPDKQFDPAGGDKTTQTGLAGN